jgi:hypothetical protein
MVNIPNTSSIWNYPNNGEYSLNARPELIKQIIPKSGSGGIVSKPATIRNKIEINESDVSVVFMID